MGWFTRTIDDLVAVFSPARAASRAAARFEYLSIRQYLNAGKKDRTSQRARAGSSSDIANVTEVTQARFNAWELYHNNPYARKAVETIIAQVWGTGGKPTPLATKPDGEKHDKFNAAALKLWEEVNTKLCYRGVPGRGGMTRDQMIAMTLRLNILSGEELLRRMAISDTKAKSIGSPIQIQFDSIQAERLSEMIDTLAPNAAGNLVYRGIETNADGVRIAYHVEKANPADPKAVAGFGETIRIPADEIIHAFLPYSPSQTRGVTWFAPASVMLSNVSDSIDNVSMSMKAQSCIALAVKRQNRAYGGLPTLATPTGSSSTDGDGNAITRMQPGMVLNLGSMDDIHGFSPSVNAGNTDAFMAFLLRGFAGSLPGVKSSTITGDYRESSFSSERSAENDAWRMIEAIQVWLFETVCQPMWDAVIEAGFQSGYFANEARGNLTMEYYRRNRANLLRCAWEGPVAKSINPAVDSKASEMDVATLRSNQVIECNNIGLEARQVAYAQVDYLADVRDYCKSKDVPVEWVLKVARDSAKLLQPVAAAKEKPPAQDKQGDKGAKSFVLPIHRMEVAPIYQNGVADA